MDKLYTNYTERKGIFINYRTLKGLVDSAYSNYKKRDYNTRCSYSNTFKVVKRVREKAFGKLKD
jgi:uncharacterized protein YktA (UPF0223 family)